MLAAIPDAARGQEADGTPLAAVAGAALGLGSGAILGTVGSMIPCTQTYIGAACVRWSAAVSGMVGLASGALIGAADQERIGDAATSAGIGVLVGVAAGLAITSVAQRIGWRDVATVGLMGGAIGAAPEGAAIGLGVGTVVGVVLWQAVPDFAFPDALGVAAAGLALGALGDWVWSAIDAQSNTDVTMQFVFPLRVGF